MVLQTIDISDEATNAHVSWGSTALSIPIEQSLDNLCSSALNSVAVAGDAPVFRVMSPTCTTTLPRNCKSIYRYDTTNHLQKRSHSEYYS